MRVRNVRWLTVVLLLASELAYFSVSVHQKKESPSFAPNPQMAWVLKVPDMIRQEYDEDPETADRFINGSVVVIGGKVTTLRTDSRGNMYLEFDNRVYCGLRGLQSLTIDCTIVGESVLARGICRGLSSFGYIWIEGYQIERWERPWLYNNWQPDPE